MKRFFKQKRMLLPLSIFICIPIIFHLLDFNHIYKALMYNFVGIDDHELFYSRNIKKSPNPDQWEYAENYNKKEISTKFQKFSDSLQTTSFLVIKDKKIVLEHYYGGYSDTSHTNSFSMAKSYISALIGFALQDGKIKSLDQPVSDFLNSFKTDGKEKITIKHVLMMSSGLSWDESYAGPFSITTKAYYGNNLKKIIEEEKAIETPGIEFKYLSGNTQVLALILEEATGKRVADYASEKLSGPLGHEQDAFWSLDRENGTEKAYCCISTNARDFARIGQLYLDSGKWNNRQLLDKDFILESLKPNELRHPETKKPLDFYGYHWWLIPEYNQGIFYARGILGQYIIGIPEKNIVIVRLGHDRGERREGTMHYEVTYQIIDEVNRLFP